MGRQNEWQTFDRKLWICESPSDSNILELGCFRMTFCHDQAKWWRCGIICCDAIIAILNTFLSFLILLHRREFSNQHWWQDSAGKKWLESKDLIERYPHTYILHTHVHTHTYTNIHKHTPHIHTNTHTQTHTTHTDTQPHPHPLVKHTHRV